MPIGIDMNNYDISMGTGQIRMSGGGTFTSDNSINYDWISRASPADYIWFGITYGAGLFVAIGYNGSDKSVATSPDGINWTLRTTPGSGWRSVVYGNGVFVAVGDAGVTNRIMTSTDGISWTAINQFTTTGYLYVAYGLVNGTTPTFVAVGHNGTNNRIIYSTNNGVTWTGITTYDVAFYSCAFGNGRFVALSADAPYALYSSNGISWTQTTVFQVGHDWNAVTYANGLFVAVSGSLGNGTGGQNLISRVATSPDGITWTNRYSPDNIALLGVAGGAGIFVAVGTGVGNRTITSTDGITWTLRPSANDSVGWRQVCYGNGIFVAVANAGTGNRVMTLDPAYGMSINKITTEETTTNLVKFGQNGATISANPSKNFAWVARSAANAINYRAICYGNGLFVATGWNNTNNIMTSPDGYIWTNRVQSTADFNATCVCYGELSANNMYVIMANSSGIPLTSTNGIDWSTSTNIGADFWGGVCFGYDTSMNGLFVAVRYNGSTNSVATSSNGTNWTLRTAVANTWRSVCYGYNTSGTGLFVAVSTSGTNRVMYSYNGITWTGVASANESAEWYSVCYGNGLFVAVANAGTGNRVMTSPNGITWTSRTAVSYSWRSVCYGNGLFTAVADVGFGQNAMTSPDGINWTLRTTPFDISYGAVTYGNGTFVAVAEYATQSTKVMTNDYTANDNMLVLNGGINAGGTTKIIGGSASANFNGMIITSIGNTLDNIGQRLIFSMINGTTEYNQGAIGTLRESNIGNYSASIAFYPSVNGILNERMRILSDGKVGIGTTSPAYTLDVSGGPIRALGNYYSGAVSNVTNFLTGVFIETNTGTGASSDGKTFMGLKSISGGGGAGFVFTRGLGYQTALQVYTNTDTSQVNGSLNTAGPYVISGGTSWASASDERLKDNITELNDNTLDNVCNIRAVEYTWKSRPMSKKCIGFIAQNVQEYYPEVVETNPGDGYLGIEYTSMIPVLLKSIQQLKSKLDDTKQTLDDALQRIQILESK